MIMNVKCLELYYLSSFAAVFLCVILIIFFYFISLVAPMSSTISYPKFLWGGWLSKYSIWYLRGSWTSEEDGTLSGVSSFIRLLCVSSLFVCSHISFRPWAVSFKGSVKRKGLLIAKTLNCFPLENLACEILFRFLLGHCCVTDLC